MSAITAAGEHPPLSNEAEVRDALAWANDILPNAVESGKNVVVWLWESIEGDFNDERSTGQIAFDAGISIIPYVDQFCDVRDFVANCLGILLSKEREETRWKWISLVLTLIGIFPSLGSVVKGVLKIFFLFVRRHGINHIAIAVEEGMTWVITYLRKREVQKYLRLQHIDEVYEFLANEIRALRGKVNAEMVLKQFDRGLAMLNSLLAKVSSLPIVGKKAQAIFEQVLKARRMADARIGEVLKPVQEVLDVIARRLDMECLMHRNAVRNATNVHFRGTLPEARAVSLMRQPDPWPAWLSKGKVLRWEPLEVGGDDATRALAAADAAAKAEARAKARLLGINESAVEVEHWPPLRDSNIESFHTLIHAEVVGPARLYRIGSPSSGAMGDCWVSEEVFERIRNSKDPDPKTAWRKYLAVWPDWNSDGQFFVYEVKEGEKLKVWRGQASSQVKPKEVVLDANLEGGWEQVIFKPTKDNKIQNDSFRIFEDAHHDGKLMPSKLTIEEFHKLGDAEVERRGAVKLREKINDPHINGPYATGWKETDFDAELRGVKIGLPTLPGQEINL